MTERLHFHFSLSFIGECVTGMVTHSSVLAWRILGTGEPGGLPSMGSHRVGHNSSDLAAVCHLEAIFWVPPFVLAPGLLQGQNFPVSENIAKG